MPLAFCVDYGSTFTKGALVDTASGDLVATASHPTTLSTDVLDGWDAVRRQLARHVPDGEDPEVLACSSAGGGLRIGVVGNEELVTAEAGRRVALSSGGRVVHVSSGRVEVAALAADEPDVVLLVGGTDGGNADVLLGNARELAGVAWRTPIVVAGNREAADEVSTLLTAGRVAHSVADNVVPRIGVLAPSGARSALRAMFVSHVIGGKHLSSRADFSAMVRGATPDVVLTAVEVLARGCGGDRPGVGDVVVVDVGGATTDVHSVIEVDPEDSGLGREVVATVPVSRTVEGDLGMRWSAEATVEAARRAGLEVPAELESAAAARRREPGFTPASSSEADHDLSLASIAVRLAVRRHAGRSQVVFAPDGRLVERTGKDLREVDLLVGSGGALRHTERSRARRILESATGERVEGGWLVPRAPRLVVDSDYVLAAAGLLAADHPAAAYDLLRPLCEQEV